MQLRPEFFKRVSSGVNVREFKPNVVNAACNSASLAGHVVEYIHHDVVRREHVRREAFDAVLARDARKVTNQEPADAAALEIVVHRESDFGVVRGGIVKVAAHANHPLAALERNEAHDGHVVVIIERDEFLHLLVLQMPDQREIALSDRFGVGVEQFLEQLFIRRLDGPEENFESILELRSRLILFRVWLQARWQGDLVRMDQAGLARLPHQFVAEFRMRDVNQRDGAFADGLSVKRRNAVFGHNVMNVGARSHHPRAGLEPGDDSGDRTVFRRGGKGDDRFSVFRARRAANEIHLPAEAAVKLSADGIRANLAGQIHFNRRADGDHPVIARDLKRVVGEFRGAEFKMDCRGCSRKAACRSRTR